MFVEVGAESVVERREIETRNGRAMVFYEQTVVALVPAKALMSKVVLSWRGEEEVLGEGMWHGDLESAISLGNFGKLDLQWSDVKWSRVEKTRAQVLKEFV